MLHPPLAPHQNTGCLLSFSDQIPDPNSSLFTPSLNGSTPLKFKVCFHTLVTSLLGVMMMMLLLRSGSGSSAASVGQSVSAIVAVVFVLVKTNKTPSSRHSKRQGISELDYNSNRGRGYLNPTFSQPQYMLQSLNLKWKQAHAARLKSPVEKQVSFVATNQKSVLPVVFTSNQSLSPGMVKCYSLQIPSSPPPPRNRRQCSTGLPIHLKTYGRLGSEVTTHCQAWFVVHVRI